MCFTHSTEVYTPDVVTPCTYVHPVGYESAPAITLRQGIEINIFPVPAYDVLHIAGYEQDTLCIVQNTTGQVVWQGPLLPSGKTDINIRLWPRGIYFVKFITGNGACITKKIQIK